MANVECRKFAPNIFNKSKCSNCFRLKEDHSASAIELNKASRKISKCGYLFVAPDWDFSNPINRTKRWQRRWFVLYDDGELTYSVDDHPETIPQACIDMNKVMEVARADDVTGNLYSVAITAQDRVHFVKGTCKEESTWWLEVLQIFPRSSIKTGRAKRNATFPGGISTTYMAQYAKEAKEAQEAALETPPVSDKGVTSEGDKLSKSLVHEVPTRDTESKDDKENTVTKRETSAAKTDIQSSAGREPKRQLSDAGSGNNTVTRAKNEETQRYKKIKSKTSEGTRAYRSLRSNTCENLTLIPQDYSPRKSSRLVKAELPPTPLFSASVSSSSVKYSSSPASPAPSPAPVASSTPTQPPPPQGPQQPVIQIDSPQTETEESSPASSPPVSPQSGDTGVSPPPPELPVRGVPDGCGLDVSLQTTPISSTPDKASVTPQIPIPSPHELLNLKKGWLMKQSPTKDWHKHWFVLQGTALMYFRDPSAENNGLMDGIIDMGLVQKVEEREVARNYGFIVSTFDERQYTLSAVTHGIRNNWINALRTASNLSILPEPDKPRRKEKYDTAGETTALSRRNTTDTFVTSPPSSSSSGSMTRSMSEDKPRSEATIPISPPLTRTPTSRIKKEKSKLSRAGVSLKSSQSLNNFGLQSLETDRLVASRDDDDDLNMIPERDTNSLKVTPIELTQNGSANVNKSVIEPEVGSLKSQLEPSQQSDLLQVADVSGKTSVKHNDNGDTDNNMNNVQSMSVSSHAELVSKHRNEMSALKKRLENMNGDMDATLKNLNNEQVKNAECDKKIQDLEQSNSLLTIKCSNAEKSLREQSKEITSLNQKVREFSDLSSQYKSQVVENKTLRQKLEKMERMNNGPNWKTLYESLQEQHNKERGLWENKLKEMEHEMQNMIDNNNEVEHKAHIITDLSHQLQDSEQRINHLLFRTDSLEKDNVAIKKAYDDEISRLRENIKELEEYIDRADSEKNAAENAEIVRLRQELSEKANYEQEINELEGNVAKMKGENDALRHKLRDVDEKPEKDVKTKGLSSSRENIDKQIRLTRMDSLAELMTPVIETAALEGMDHEEIVICYNDVLKRLGKAINEIRSQKNSVKTAQNAADEMEIANIRLNQSLGSAEAHYTEQIKMLSTKIEDLTSKYLSAEKQARLLKLKCNEVKSRRRSSTGIRPDEFLINKEAELVLEDIETNLLNIEGFVKGKEPAANNKESRKKSYEISTKASRARRKSSESSELSFVERLKKTDKTIADLNRKLSVPGDGSSIHLETIRKQINATISKCKTDLISEERDAQVSVEELDKLLSNIDVLVSSSDIVPEIAVQEPGFPECESISSHLDTVMTFLFRCVESSHQMRREAVAGPTDTCAAKIMTQYEAGVGLAGAADLGAALQAQAASLQSYLLLDLQHQVARMETKFSAYGREQTLKYYGDVTRTMLLKLLESRHFVPLSDYSSLKIKQLASLNLDTSCLRTMFRRLQSEANTVFSNIGSITQSLMGVLVDAIVCDISDKESIVDNIRTEVLNLIEEDDRMRDFKTNAVNIFLIGSDHTSGKDPERINLMANHEEATQSQAEVARILIDQEIQDLVNAIDVRIECTEKDSVFPASKELNDVENLSECIIKIASMLSQKCITEAQITILNTILGCEQNSGKTLVDEDDNSHTVSNFVFSPENMNNECSEFMLVLNNYRQQSLPACGQGQQADKFSSLTSGASGASLGNTSIVSLETNLRTLRQENENKMARLSAALDDKKNVSAQDLKLHDLRQWCEKSMTAMEKSYENLLQDLQHQHLKEKDSLRKEKEQALAEETQATLAALDAMRKAHESEVQKEVDKFKKEFVADHASKACIGALQTEFQTNRQEMKREILSVTGGEAGWDSEDTDSAHAHKLTRSPSCPRLYGALSLTTSPAKTSPESEPEPLASPLTGMVANRKRVFENEY